jgi:chromatin remodeling complex protein RSC6
MQTRSGKTYTATSSLENKKIRIEIKGMKTRSGKTYTATSCLEKNKTSIDIKVDNRIINTDRHFSPQYKISNQLAKFLGKPVGTIMRRTDVLSYIRSYIKTKNLEDVTSKTIINYDAKLGALLKIGKNERLTYFNLAIYLKPHIIRYN